MPRFWGTFLLILGPRPGLPEGGFRRSSETEEARPSTAARLKNWITGNYEVVLTFLFIGIYSVLLSSVSFTIMSALFIFAQILI